MTDQPLSAEWGSDLDVAEWLVWFARKYPGRARDVAQQALNQHPGLRFSERLTLAASPPPLETTTRNRRGVRGTGAYEEGARLSGEHNDTASPPPLRAAGGVRDALDRPNGPMFIPDAASPPPLDVELIRRVTDGWYGNGTSGKDWDDFMAMMREYARLTEPSDD